LSSLGGGCVGLIEDPACPAKDARSHLVLPPGALGALADRVRACCILVLLSCPTLAAAVWRARARDPHLPRALVRRLESDRRSFSHVRRLLQLHPEYFSYAALMKIEKRHEQQFRAQKTNRHRIIHFEPPDSYEGNPATGLRGPGEIRGQERISSHGCDRNVDPLH
jgi:hypothetical protein